MRPEKENKADDNTGSRGLIVRLLLGDVDAIKAFVYETSALPEIRGGSEILLELEEEIRKLFPQNHPEKDLIYCGGGGFLAMVPINEADELKRKIEQLYLDRTKIATITVVTSDPIDLRDLNRGIPPYDERMISQLQGRGVARDLLFSHFEAIVENRIDRKNFGELVAQLTGKLQEAKRRKESAPFYETMPVHQRCQSCGKRAAEEFDDKRAEWLCGVCLMKRQKGRKRVFLDEFRMWAQREKGVKIAGKLSQDLDTLAAGEGRIALLYADGNNMGDLLQRENSLLNYRKISEALETATKEALFEALWKIFGSKLQTQDPLPFEIIALGGDDVVVIVPASATWTLAAHLLKGFEAHPKIQDLNEGARLSMSAGLAIADVKYPVRYLFDLAEGLLKEAKRLAREKQTGTLCHLWLRAPVISEDVKVILEALYARDEPARHLTARPYTVRQAEQLLMQANKLSRIPASQRRALAEALEKGVHVSLNYALYQAARSKEYKEVLIAAFEELGKLVEPAAPYASRDVKMNVSLSRHRKTAYEERLFFTEVAWHSWLDVKIQGVFRSDSEARRAAALLWLGSRMGYAIGAARSRGLGWVKLEEFQASVNGLTLSNEDLVREVKTLIQQPGEASP